MNDRWTIMNNSASELDAKTHTHKRCCSVLLWGVAALVTMTVVVAATVAVLHLQHHPLPFISGSPLPTSPIISTHEKENGALVTVSRGDSQPISIFLDPNCPDLSSSLMRWEEVERSLLRLLSGHGERGVAHTLAEELKLLSGHAHNLHLEADWLKRGQGALSQRLEALQSDQSNMMQLLADRQDAMLQVMRSASDSLLELQRETLINSQHAQADVRGFRPQDCSELQDAGFTSDGVYSIYPTHDAAGFRVYCDMTTDGGGWTVIQRRMDGSVNFFRGWTAYRDGFGDMTGEHWIGLHRIFLLTASGRFQLRVDLSDFDNVTAFALYGSFAVGLNSVNPEEDGYPLTVLQYSGTAGDSLLKHSGMRFTTKDRDQDQSENNCAAYYQGAWWYRNCHTSNLNGQYLHGGHASYADGVEWSSWTGWQYSLRFTEMKVRPAIGAKRDATDTSS